MSNKDKYRVGEEGDRIYQGEGLGTLVALTGIDRTEHTIQMVNRLNMHDTLVELIREMEPGLWHRYGCARFDNDSRDPRTCICDREGILARARAILKEEESSGA